MHSDLAVKKKKGKIITASMCDEITQGKSIMKSQDIFQKTSPKGKKESIIVLRES